MTASCLASRPDRMALWSANMKTVAGTLTLDVHIHDEQPFEVFINVGAAGSDLLADAAAMGRLLSAFLRVESPVDRFRRLEEAVELLRHIGGSWGRDGHEVSSLPNGVARLLQEFLEEQMRMPSAP